MKVSKGSWPFVNRPKSKDRFQKVNDFGSSIDRMIKSKILSQLESA